MQLRPLRPGSGNVFVVGFNGHQHRHLRTLDPDGRFKFHSLVPQGALRRVRELPVARILEAAEGHLGGFRDPVDAILSFVDFPGIEIAAILAGRRGLPGPTLEAVLRCNHKLWSRQLQAEIAPETCPRFSVADPFDDGALARLESRLSYPFWIKPLNGYASYLGFRIDEPETFRRVVPRIRAGIRRLADPLEHLMEQAEVPDTLRRMGGNLLLAEEVISGTQCTLEGYVFRGASAIYGVVDSIQESNRTSFARYEYPSRLPEELQDRMADVAERVIRHMKFDDGVFNIEFYHEPHEDRLWLLEVNPRLSQSHLELFEKVDGASHQKVAVEIALGREPGMPRREGEYPNAAKFFLRAWEDGCVTRVPDPPELRSIEEEVPGTTILLRVEEGTRLSEVPDQDSYSYELAWIWIGARGRPELLEKFEKVKELLRIEIEPVAHEPDVPAR